MDLVKILQILCKADIVTQWLLRNLKWKHILWNLTVISFYIIKKGEKKRERVIGITQQGVYFDSWFSSREAGGARTHTHT